MNTFKHQGDAIDYTPDADVTAGKGIVIGSLFGITKLPITANEVGALALRGVFLCDKAAVAFTLGEAVYFDEADDEMNGTSSGNTLAGYAVKAAAADDTQVWVRLAN